MKNIDNKIIIGVLSIVFILSIGLTHIVSDDSNEIKSLEKKIEQKNKTIEQKDVRLENCITAVNGSTTQTAYYFLSTSNLREAMRRILASDAAGASEKVNSANDAEYDAKAEGAKFTVEDLDSCRGN